MRGLHRSLLFSAFALILVTGTAVFAQATTPPRTCPPKALLSLARAGAACVNLEPGTACYGSGSASSTPQVGSAAPGLVQLGDRVPLRDLASVSVAHTGDDTVSIAELTIRTSPRASDVLTILLIGEANVASQVMPPAEQIMQATGAITVRALPAEDAQILATLGVNNRIVANGKYQNWLRVAVPATGETGWVAVSLLSGDTSHLSEAEPGAAVAQPFSAIALSSNGGTSCGSSLHDGALLQSPSTDKKDAVTVNFNNLTLRLAGTAFYTNDSVDQFLIILDGSAELDGVQIVPAGAEVSLLMPNEGDPLARFSEVRPYDASLVTALPINNLPRRFTVTPLQTQDAIDARIAELTAPPPTPVPTIAVPDNACRRSVGRLTTVWSGPGENYEALTRLDAGTPIKPVLSTNDTGGAEWWQLENSGWVARVNVVQRGDCLPVPVVARVAAPPTNSYSLERCASNNGPVRAGQSVTFEFIPAAWDNYGEALAATNTDPGHFTLNSEWYYAYASQPFRLGAKTDPLEDRYLRRFTMTWTAQPGTYRVTGDWLSYEPSCNLTVPVE